MAIQVLSEQVIAQIAAGEVIERPASVVKELVENALDAGASTIHITVENGGRRLIRATDNGSGIPAAEVELAFERHATSKLRSADDLVGISTLGFRGEALASIASVSRISITTRHRDETVGTTLQIEGGIVIQRRSTGAPLGTSLTVEHLFFNTPARLKFLKAENTERRHIDTVVSRYAMAYPHIRFLLEQDGREAFRSNGGELSDVLVAALGLDIFRDMILVEGETPINDGQGYIRLSGFTSGPGTHRADRSRIVLFVNGRWIQDTGITFAVVQAYHTLLTKGRYPITVLMIDIPPEEVDVNVHPAKAEVRFRNPNAVFSAVQRAVRQAVIGHGATPLINRSQTDNLLAPLHPYTSDQMPLDLPLETTGRFRHQHADEAADPTAIPYGPSAPAQPRTLPLLRVVGQVGASYIVAEGPAGMYLVDQHAAHERVLYEQFMAEYARGTHFAQLTLASQTIELPMADARLIDEHLDLLRAVGFTLEPFGPGIFLIRSVPAILADRDPVETLHGVVEELEMGRQPAAAPIEERLIRRVCKQAAVKAGTILSLDQMQGLIRQLERCLSPHTCPHGRPTMIHLSSEQLAREFSRK